MIFKTIVIVLFLAVLVALGSAFTALLRPGNRTKSLTAKALTYRVALSLVLFAALIFGYATGLITPHGL